MGAAASIEMEKPVDASEIRSTGSLIVAKNEVIRLRETLGHLAKQAGMTEVVYDASDICFDVNEEEDFERCVEEIAHIRRCLQLRPQSVARRARGPYVQQHFAAETKSAGTADEPESEDSSDDDHK